MIPRPDVLVGNLTHVGMERSVNQDYYGFFEPEDDAQFEALGRLIVVCDGMGGHAGGEVASRLAVNSIIEAYRQDRSGNVLEAMRLSIEAANKAVWDEGQAKPELKGMGTTVVALVLRQGMAYFAHVGDSRCYLIRGGQLHQITLDHSLVQQMVNEGLLAEEEMENHPEKNVILRSLGVKPDVDVELNYQPYQIDDLFMLSSDGLTGLVSKEECLQIGTMHRDQPMQGCAQLVDLANRYGGYDNITVQIARVLAMSSEEALVRQQQQSPAAPPPPVAEQVKLGPSQQEMAENVAAAATPGGGQSITGVMTPEEVERIKQEALAEAKRQAAEEAAAAAPAQVVSTGGQLPMPIVGAIGGGALVVGLLLGLLFGGGDGSAEIKELSGQGIEQAILKLDTPNKEELRDSLDALHVAIKEGDPDKAEKEIEKLKGLPTGDGSVAGAVGDEELDSLQSRLDEARDSARGVKASEKARLEWNQATKFGDEAKQAREKDDPTLAYASMLKAVERYTQARRQALLVEAKAKVQRLEALVRQLVSEAEGVQASEHVPEYMAAASSKVEQARAVKRSDPGLAVGHYEMAVLHYKAAVRWAPYVEQKKKLTKAFRSLKQAKESAAAAGATKAPAAMAVYEEAVTLETEARRQMKADELTASLQSVVQATSLFASAKGKAEEDKGGQQAVAARAKAEAARENAFNRKAQTYAIKLLQKGDQARDDGDTFLSQGKPDQAATAFETALAYYTEAATAATAGAKKARVTARVAMENSQAARRRADIAKANQGAGRGSYAKALMAEQDGETAMESERFDPAVAYFNQATSYYEQAIKEANQAHRASNPKAVEAEQLKQAMEVAKAECMATESPKQPFFNYAKRYEKLGNDDFERGKYGTAKDYFKKAKDLYVRATKK
ncbi:Stp1/IreP family PP2C-type Ser/Thr phosphatase [Planctomycetota bacterium]